MTNAPFPHTLTPPPPIPGTRIDDDSPPPPVRWSNDPPIRPRPPKPAPIRPNLYRPLLLAVIVATAFAIVTVGTPMRSIGWVIALTTLSIAMVTTSARRPAAIVIGLVATSFIPWLAIRMSPWLITLNLLVATVLLIASIALPAAGSLRVSGWHHLHRLLQSTKRLPSGPRHLSASVGDTVQSVGLAGGLRRWGPSVLVGMATLTGALALLASGDALLASFFDVGEAPQQITQRLFAAAIGFALFAVLIGGVAPPGMRDSPKSVRVPTPSTSLCAIVGLALAIALYAATQASAALLGADFVRRRTGLTYAEYARGGFFQLVVVSAVATLAMVVARAVVRRHPGTVKRFRIASAVLTVAVVVTVVSSVTKLVIYAETFGLTMLRLYAAVFACWLGLVSVATFGALFRSSREWLAPAMIASVVVGAFAMNVVNPERLVAEHNITRSESTGKLDVDYLRSLSLDAAPVIFEQLDGINAEVSDADDLFRSSDYSSPAGKTTVARDAIRITWCARVADEDRSGLSFNRSRDAAFQASRSECP